MAGLETYLMGFIDNVIRGCEEREDKLTSNDMTTLNKVVVIINEYYQSEETGQYQHYKERAVSLIEREHQRIKDLREKKHRQYFMKASRGEKLTKEEQEELSLMVAESR